MTNTEFKTNTFKAYKTLVKLYKQEIEISDFIAVMQDLLNMTISEHDVLDIYSHMNAEKVKAGIRKVKSIATFRKGVKDGFETIKNLEVEYTEPAAPTNTVKTIHWNYVILFKNGTVQVTNDKMVADTMRTCDYVSEVRDCTKAA